MQIPVRCPLTNELVIGFTFNKTEVRYKADLHGKPIEIFFCRKCFEKITSNNSAEGFRYIIKALLINKKINNETAIKFHWYEENVPLDMEGINLYDLINKSMYPRQPKELLNNLLKELVDSQTYSGEKIEIGYHENLGNAFYLKTNDEFGFYLKTLVERGHIKIESESKSGFSIRVTYGGLEEYLRIFDEGHNSNICFVAMSFSKEHDLKRLAIKKAIEDTGFKPKIIDEEYNPTDRTINDGIIAGIKKSKFCIADFCDHKNGVYFEAGFALGLGKPVIFTCHSNHREGRHFDISPMHTIFYDSEEQLTEMLTNYINAWIK